ncbi:hypothetical protein IFR05_011326 [Cadophora sp. M221]|nr:hypothetical protein IFR05_011326 [Cadophora sp. M221]
MEFPSARFSGSSAHTEVSEPQKTQLRCSLPISPPYSISDISPCATPEPSPVSFPVASGSTTSIRWLSHQASLVLSDDSIKGFTDRSQHLFKTFDLSASRINPISNCTLEGVVRLSVWWFLLGNMKLEQLIREGSSFPFAQEDNYNLLQQALVEIAKSLWVIIIAGPVRELSSSDGETNLPHLLSARLNVLSRIRQAVWALNRHGFLPPQESDSCPLSSNDSSIWVDYPSVGLDMNVLLSSSNGTTSRGARDTADLSDAFMLSDTEDTFHYSSMAMDVFLFNEGSNSQQIRYACILSIIRGISEKTISIVVSSQDGLLEFSTKPDGSTKPTWEDVTWLFFINTLEVKLPTGFRLQLRFSPWDFRNLKRMYDHCCLTLESFQPVLGEEALCFETIIKSTYYHTSRQSRSQHFPRGSTAQCTLRIFEKSIVRSEGTGVRTIHKGYRIALMTPPIVKKLSIIVQEWTPERSIQFEFLRGENGNPALSLKIDETDPRVALVLVFSESEQRNQLLAHLTGSLIKDDETVLAQAPLSSFSWTTDMRPTTTSKNSDPFQWHTVRVISKQPCDPDKLHIGNSQPSSTDSLRIILDSAEGRITDRVNVRIGELRIRRNVIASGHELRIWRQPQEDLTVSLSDLPVPSEIPQQMTGTLKRIQELPSVRTYRFPNLTDLHMFQAAVTGFTVLFDGTPSSFTISRRRMMVPINKEWSSSHTRIQILRRGNQVQLVVFFEGFSNGECMNFAMKGIDVFEKSVKGGVTYLRLVDGKFALPAGGKRDFRDERGFVCLDLLEYPGEHNDITIGFASTNEYERFAEALPAPVRAK